MRSAKNATKIIDKIYKETSLKVHALVDIPLSISSFVSVMVEAMGPSISQLMSNGETYYIEDIVSVKEANPGN